MTQTKPCFICQARLALHGPTLCDEHGGLEQRDHASRYVSIKQPISEPLIGLYFETVGDPDLGVPDTVLSSIRTSLTEAWCGVHWKAYPATSPWCPVCRMAEQRKLVQDAKDKVQRYRDALTATDAELEARGWSKDVDAAIEQSRPKGKGRKMARKKADEKNGNGEHADPSKVINHTNNLRCKLTDAQKIERGELAARKARERDRLDDERKSHSSHLGGRIKTLDTEIRKLNSEFLDGFEYRDTSCQTRYHLRTLTMQVVRMDTNEVIEERAMTPEEVDEHKQVPIQAKGANEENAKPVAEKPSRGRKRAPASEQTASPAE